MNSYEYIDPDYIYTDAKTGVLRNKENIDDKKVLAAFESIKVAEKLDILQSSPIRPKNSKTLLDIHKFLFGGIYAWAGQVRTVEISKGGKGFLPTVRFETGFAHINRSGCSSGLLN
jgi:cell filamentation protein